MKPSLEKAQIHPTNKCNLNCAFCDVPVRYKNHVDLSDEKWISIAKDLTILKPKIVTISGGGEPLLRTNLVINIMKMLNEAGIKSEIITNGTFVSKKLLSTVLECGVLYRASVHSVSVRKDKILRGVKNSVNLSFKGIKILSEMKKKVKKEEPKIEIVMVITKHNVDEIEKMIKKAPKLGVDKISLRIVHKYGESLKPTNEQMNYLKKNLKKYKKIAQKLGIEFDQDFIPEEVFEPERSDKKCKKPGPICMLPFTELVVFADGRVAPCCNFIIDPIGTTGVDTVLKKSLVDIWFGKEFNKLRKIVEKRKSKQLPKTCKDCSFDLSPIDERYRKKI